MIGIAIVTRAAKTPAQAGVFVCRFARRPQGSAWFAPSITDASPGRAAFRPLLCLLHEKIAAWSSTAEWLVRRLHRGHSRFARIPTRDQAASASRFGTTSFAARMPASYSRYIGIASISCETASGGVITAATATMPISA